MPHVLESVSNFNSIEPKIIRKTGISPDTEQLANLILLTTS